MWHTLKCAPEILTDTLHKAVESFKCIEKIGIQENQSVYKLEISLDENDIKCKVKLSFNEFHDIIPDKFENCKR